MNDPNTEERPEVAIGLVAAPGLRADLGENLLEHLDFEELSVKDTVLRVRESPGL